RHDRQRSRSHKASLHGSSTLRKTRDHGCDPVVSYAKRGRTTERGVLDRITVGGFCSWRDAAAFPDSQLHRKSSHLYASSADGLLRDRVGTLSDTCLSLLHGWVLNGGPVVVGIRQQVARAVRRNFHGDSVLLCRRLLS